MVQLADSEAELQEAEGLGLDGAGHTQEEGRGGLGGRGLRCVGNGQASERFEGYGEAGVREPKHNDAAQEDKAGTEERQGRGQARHIYPSVL